MFGKKKKLGVIGRDKCNKCAALPQLVNHGGKNLCICEGCGNEKTRLHQNPMDAFKDWVDGDRQANVSVQGGGWTW